MRMGTRSGWARFFGWVCPLALGLLGHAMLAQNTPPQFTLQPVVVDHEDEATPTFEIGSVLRLRVEIAGSEPLHRQWHLNGRPIPGETNALLEIASVNDAHGGYYSVIASNAYGVAASLKQPLRVRSLVLMGDSPMMPTNPPVDLGLVRSLSLGHYHLLAAKEDGALAAWRTGTAGVTNVPPGLRDVVEVAAGGSHNLALRRDRTVVGWVETGRALQAAAQVPTNLTSVVAISTSGTASLALRDDGRVVGWGAVTVPSNLSNVVAIAGGAPLAVALRRDGRVVTWGRAIAGLPAGLTNAIAVSVGGSRGLVLREDGTLLDWGVNVVPVPARATNVVAIAASDSLNLALRADGGVVAWAAQSNALHGEIERLTNVVAVVLSQRAPLMAALLGDGSPRMTLQPAGQIVRRQETVRLHGRVVGRQPMSYQWRRDGVEVPGATNATLILAAMDAGKTGSYQLVATNSLGMTVSDPARISFAAPGTLADVLDSHEVSWVSFQNSAPWFPQAEESHDGVGAARSGAITHGQSSILQTQVRGPGTVSFWWKVSSEAGYDLLRFTDNGSSNNPAWTISGESGWQEVTATLSPGQHTLRWTYAKDPSLSYGQDAAWLDEVVFTPALPVISSGPEDRVLVRGWSDSLAVAHFGMEPTTVRWFKDGLPMAGENDIALQFPQVSATNAGRYSVTVSNAAGVVVSREAVIRVIDRPVLGLPRLQPDGQTLFSLPWPTVPRDDATIVRFSLWSSTNLVDWSFHPVTSREFNDGEIILRDAGTARPPALFYKLTP